MSGHRLSLRVIELNERATGILYFVALRRSTGRMNVGCE